MMKCVVFFFITYVSLSCDLLLSQPEKRSKEIAITIDDLPFVTYGVSDTGYQRALTDRLLGALQRHSIHAIGFVNEGRVRTESGVSPFCRSILEQWLRNGMELGNHTYSHKDYTTVSFIEYSEDIIRGESVLKDLLAAPGASPLFFRHPYLHTGDTKSKADSLKLFLENRGYRIAPVTIDNEDFLFALAYKKISMKNDSLLMKRIGADYISYMERKLFYFEKQSVELFGRKIAQTLLIHASLLNADYADSLACMCERNGYRFVSLRQALKDPAYTTEITVFGKWGISWIERWALSKGKKGNYFADDPATPQYIMDIAKEKK